MAWDWKRAFDVRSVKPTKERLALGGAVLAVALGAMAAFGAFEGDGEDITFESGTVSEVDASGVVRVAGAQPAANKVPYAPALQRKRGRTFAYLLPVGWKASETSNGLDLAAPDGAGGVTVSFAVGSFGRPSPEEYLRYVMNDVGHGGARFTSLKPVPDQPGPMGLTWKGIEAEFDSTQAGKPIRVRANAYVLQGWGQFAGMIKAVQAPPDTWDNARLWLPYVRDAIEVVDPGAATGPMSAALPKGIRHEQMFGPAPRSPGGGFDVSKAQREGMMGYERAEDRETGQVYDMPLGAWDASAGGYRNPVRPDELLATTDR